MSHWTVSILVTISLLFVITQAQVLKFGKCPQYKIADSFNPKEYFTGRFYEQKRFWAIFELNSKCVHADYSLLPNDHVKVNNSGVNIKLGTRNFQVGDAYCEAEKPAACHVQFYEGTPYGDYNVLAADPNKYGLVFTCREQLNGLINYQFAWILTRDKTVDEKDMQAYLQVFKDQGIDISKFNDIPQDCKDN